MKKWILLLGMVLLGAVHPVKAQQPIFCPGINVWVKGSCPSSPPITVSQLPAATSSKGQVFGVTDGASATDCTTGGGTTAVVCQSNGTMWVSVGGSGGGVTTFNGRGGAVSLSSSDVSAACPVPSCNTDTTNAGNIATGLLPNARLSAVIGGTAVGVSTFGVHDLAAATAYTIAVGDDKKMVINAPASVAAITLPQPSTGTSPFVGITSNAACAVASSCAVTRTITAGNFARIEVQFENINSKVQPTLTIADNKGDSLQTGASVNGGSGAVFDELASFYGFNLTGGSTIFTVSCSGVACSDGSTIWAVFVLEYNSTLTAIDGTYQTATNTTGIPHNSVTTNFQNDIVFMSNYSRAGCPTFVADPVGGFVIRQDENSDTGRCGGIYDGLFPFSGIQNIALSSASSTWGYQNIAAAFKTTTALTFLNGFSFSYVNRGTAPAVLTPTSSKIFTEWYGGLTSAQPVPVYPNQEIDCMSDSANWQCHIFGVSVNGTNSPVTVSGNVNTAQNLMSAVVKGNTTNKVNNAFHVWAAGNYSTEAANTSTITIAVKLGSVTLATWTSAANLGGQTNDDWNVDLYFISTATGTAGFKAHGNLVLNGIASATKADVYADVNNTTTGTVDQTADQTLQVTITFSSAGAAAGNIGKEDELVVSQVN